MPLFAGAERIGHIFTHIHPLSTLIVQAHNRRHTVAAGTAFERRGYFFRITDRSGCRACTRGKGGGQHAGIALTCLTAPAGKRSMQLRCETCIAIAFRHDTGCNKGLLLHPRLRGKRTGQIMQVAHLITLVLCKGNGLVT